MTADVITHQPWCDREQHRLISAGRACDGRECVSSVWGLSVADPHSAGCSAIAAHLTLAGSEPRIVLDINDEGGRRAVLAPYEARDWLLPLLHALTAEDLDRVRTNLSALLYEASWTEPLRRPW